MADIAMIGDYDSVLLARAAGLDAYGAADGEEVKKLVTRLTRGKVKVIFITEELYAEALETVEKYKTSAFPAIIPIPDKDGSKGIGMKAVRANVEKAIGMDILFSEDDK